MANPNPKTQNGFTLSQKANHQNIRKTKAERYANRLANKGLEVKIYASREKKGTVCLYTKPKEA